MAAPEQPLDEAMQDAGFSSSLFAYVSGNYELYLTLRWRQPDPPPFTIFFEIAGTHGDTRAVETEPC